MAANAALRLIQQNDIDPTKVGFLGFGTESSTDNAAGAVIIKGMLDRALESMGHPRLSRSCEVPEYKHACLGGMYALKGALRYLQCEGEGRVAIVVSADIAEYERGSTGEPTQGAGAVAFLVETDPKLFSVDLKKCGHASDYRGVDFRKPFARHTAENYAPNTQRAHDFPVFNGKYSTACYVDEVMHALDDLFSKRDDERIEFYESLGAILFHRPYHYMPLQAMSAALVWAMGRNEAHHDRLRALCEVGEADFDQVLTEMASSPDLMRMVTEGDADVDPTPAVTKLLKHYRRTEEFNDFVARKLSLGSDLVMDVGNLYTASLPAWLAAAFEDALVQGKNMSGQRLLLVGYGSGDAAEAMPAVVVPGWEEAAKRIGFATHLKNEIDLTREQYEAVHDGGTAPGLEYKARGEFIVERRGKLNDEKYQDIGIEYYRYES